MKPKKYLVTSEEIATHEAVVEAYNEDEASEAYDSGDWLEDRGYTFDITTSSILSIEELSEPDDQVEGG